MAATSPTAHRTRRIASALHAVMVVTDVLSLVVVPMPLPVHIVIVVTIHVVGLGAFRHSRHR